MTLKDGDNDARGDYFKDINSKIYFVSPAICLFYLPLRLW